MAASLKNWGLLLSVVLGLHIWIGLALAEHTAVLRERHGPPKEKRLAVVYFKTLAIADAAKVSNAQSPTSAPTTQATSSQAANNQRTIGKVNSRDRTKKTKPAQSTLNASLPNAKALEKQKPPLPVESNALAPEDSSLATIPANSDIAGIAVQDSQALEHDETLTQALTQPKPDSQQQLAQANQPELPAFAKDNSEQANSALAKSKLADPDPPKEALTPTPLEVNWPNSVRIRYLMTGYYRGELHGQAMVEWARTDSRYEVTMELNSGILFKRLMRSEGLATSAGLVPQRYYQETQMFLQKPKSLQMQFGSDVITLANGKQSPQTPGVQDTASQFVQLTFLFQQQTEQLQVGSSITIPLALPNRISTWVYEVLQTELIATPLGDMQTLLLKPRRSQTRSKDLKADIWLAPTLQYLPARIRIVLDEEEAFIDLRMAELPQLGVAK